MTSKKASPIYPPEALAEFRAWFEAFDEDAWDRQMEGDISAGKFDRVARKILPS